MWREKEIKFAMICEPSSISDRHIWTQLVVKILPPMLIFTENIIWTLPFNNFKHHITQLWLKYWSKDNGHHFADDIFKCIGFFCVETFQFRKNFSDVCSLGSNWQYINRQQAIIWTIHGLVDWRIYV